MIIIPSNTGSVAPVTIRSIQHISTATNITPTAVGDMVIVYAIGTSGLTDGGWVSSINPNAMAIDSGGAGTYVCSINHKIATSTDPITVPASLIGGTHTTVAVLSNFKVSQPIGGYSKRTTAWNPWNVYDAYANGVTPVNSSGTSLFLGTNFLFTPSGASVPAGTLPLQTDARYTKEPGETYNTGANANFLCRHTYNVAAASAVTSVASSSSNYGGLFATYYCFQFEIVGN